ncbi:hypothetical protein M3Y99_00848400 [Aphelenchoides fujianensis]|nr:hypothetical protein M3Y99_00848400 [Aphelenchoides fujianensis]
MIHGQVDEDFHRFQADTSTESFQLFLFPTDAPSIKRRFGLDDRIHRSAAGKENNLPTIKELEDALVDYGAPSERWERLTGRITAKFLDAVYPTRSGGQLPSNIHFFSMTREFECAQKCKELNVEVADVQRWAIESGEYREESGFQLNFTHIPFLLQKEVTSRTCSGREVDVADHLHVLKRFNYDGKAFGELEYAFVIFWFGHVAAGLDRWSRLVHFFCLLSGEAADFYHCYGTFVSVLKTQLEVMSPAFFHKHVVSWVIRALPLIEANLMGRSSSFFSA